MSRQYEHSRRQYHPSLTHVRPATPVHIRKQEYKSRLHEARTFDSFSKRFLPHGVISHFECSGICGMKLGGAKPAFYRDRGGREEAAPVELGREWGGE